jgi:hypothetical protein
MAKQNDKKYNTHCNQMTSSLIPLKVMLLFS